MGKACRYPTLGLLMTMVVLFSSLIQVGAAQTYSTGVSSSIVEGTYVRYQMGASATYRMYNQVIQINVTNPNVYPVVGLLQLVTREDDQDVLQDIATTNLVPYIIKIDKWEVGSQNSPYAGLNDSESAIVENWVTPYKTPYGNKLGVGLSADDSALTAAGASLESNEIEVGVVFNVEEVFADSERIVAVLRFLYDYTVENRLNNSLTDNVTEIVEYKWDMQFGVLLSMRADIFNHNDSSMNGFVQGVVSQTSLWELNTEGVPGYPVCVIGMISIASVTLMVLSKRKSFATREAN